MRTFITIFCLFSMANIQAINLNAMNKAGLESQIQTITYDGPTNGEMKDDEKDTLIQVLCPGPIVTSFS